MTVPHRYSCPCANCRSRRAAEKAAQPVSVESGNNDNDLLASINGTPLGKGNRFWGRFITNFALNVISLIVIIKYDSDVAYLSLLGGIALYYPIFYWRFGGHIGHLLTGARVRDAKTGGPIALWQAIVRSGYDAALVGAALVMEQINPNGGMSILNQLPAYLFIVIPMGLMVLSRSDRRHGFDLLSGVVVVVLLKETLEEKDVQSIDWRRF